MTADNLAQLKGVTDQQLLGIYQSYVNNGASIDQQMALLAGMLRQRGIDGSNGLVQGLQSNDPTKWRICQELTLLILYKRCLLTYLEMVKTEKPVN